MPRRNTPKARRRSKSSSVHKVHHGEHCPTPGKSHYPDEDTARRKLHRIQRNPDLSTSTTMPSRIYRCVCGRWCLASGVARERTLPSRADPAPPAHRRQPVKPRPVSSVDPFEQSPNPNKEQ